MPTSIPVVDGHYPLVGHLFAFLADRAGFIFNARARYGSCFRIKLFYQNITFVLDPKDWPAIIRNSSLYFPGAEFAAHTFYISLDCFNHPDVTVELHRYYIKYLQSTEALNSLMSVFANVIRERIILERESLGDGEKTTGLLSLCHRLMFFASTRALFGDIEPQLLEEDFTIFDTNVHFFIALLPKWIYPWFWRRELEARERLNHFWLQYHCHSTNESEFIHQRTKFICNHPEWFTDNDFAGAQTAILWASLANTIPATFWSLYYILKNPVALKTIREEVVYKLPYTSLSFNVSQSDTQEMKDALDQCIYLDSAVNETLRMMSTPMTLRKCSRKTKITLHDGRTFEVNEGDAVALFPAVTHHDPYFFEQPNVFKFDRYLNRQISNAFSPFGAGKSICPGRFFAMNAIKLCIAFVLRNIQCSFIDSTHPEPIQNAHRVGIGIAPPTHDLFIRYQCVD